MHSQRRPFPKEDPVRGVGGRETLPQTRYPEKQDALPGTLKKQRACSNLSWRLCSLVRIHIEKLAQVRVKQGDTPIQLEPGRGLEFPNAFHAGISTPD